MANQRALGATITRMFVPWSQAEPLPRAWNWRNFDKRYKAILAGGLRPLLVLNNAPCWAEPTCNLAFGYPPSPSHDSDWSTYVRTVTARYPRAVGVEVWNEENLASTFYPQPDPARYTQLLHEAYTAVKSVDKSMPVISGGLAMDDGSGSAGTGFASRTFLADMLADGARSWMDGLAIHVYPTDTQSDGTRVWDPAALSRWLEQVKEVVAAAGVPKVPVWITEIGVSTTSEHGWPAPATPQEQASDLLTMIQIAQADPDVRAMLVFALQDADANPAEDLVSQLGGALLNWDIFYNQALEGLGVFKTNWSPKPAACVISKAWGGSLSC